MLLYLTSETFVGEMGEALAQEVRSAVHPTSGTRHPWHLAPGSPAPTHGLATGRCAPQWTWGCPS